MHADVEAHFDASSASHRLKRPRTPSAAKPPPHMSKPVKHLLRGNPLGGPGQRGGGNGRGSNPGPHLPSHPSSHQVQEGSAAAGRLRGCSCVSTPPRTIAAGHGQAR